jgi:3-dehydroquinate synthase class II
MRSRRSGGRAETADAGSGSSGEDAGARDGDESGPSCGGESFTAKTKVLLADGKAVPISSLKPGQKVLAATTKTGKNQAETITAVLVNHDRDLYDLKVRVGGRTAVIDTAAITCSMPMSTGSRLCSSTMSMICATSPL